MVPKGFNRWVIHHVEGDARSDYICRYGQDLSPGPSTKLVRGVDAAGKEPGPQLSQIGLTMRTTAVSRLSRTITSGRSVYVNRAVPYDRYGGE